MAELPVLYTYGDFEFLGEHRKLTLPQGTYATATYGASDFLFLPDRIFQINMNMNNVGQFTRGADNTLDVLVNYQSWHDQDLNIQKICRLNSSVPGAYTVYSKDKIDYLLGWSMDDLYLYRWEIDSVTGALKNRVNINAPVQCGAYSRGGWDGRGTIYFMNQTNQNIYAFDIATETIKFVVNIVNDQTMTSSYTGSGLVVTEEFIYWGSGANVADGFLGRWDRVSGTVQPGGVIKATNIASFTSAISGDNGTMQLDVCYPTLVYYFHAFNRSITILKVNEISGIGLIGALVTLIKPDSTVPKNTPFEFPYIVSSRGSLPTTESFELESFGTLDSYRQVRTRLDRREFKTVKEIEVN